MSNFNELFSTLQNAPLDPKTNLPEETSSKITKGNGDLSEVLNARPTQASLEPYSQRETLPDTYASYKAYLPDIVYGTDIEEQRAMAQGKSGKIGNALLRAVPVFVSKVGQTAGVVGGGFLALGAMPLQALSEGKIDSNSYGMLFDNAFINMFDQSEQYFKEALPIYKQNQYKYGTAWDKMWTADYWTEDAADAVEFMASAWAGGFTTKPLQAGGLLLKGTKLGNLVEASVLLSNAGKAGRAAGALAKWDIGVITAYNTIGEAGIEGRQVYKDLMEDYRNGVWGKDITEEQAKEKAGQAALKTFGFNTLILAVPNFIETSFFFGSHTLNKTAIKSILAGDNIASSYAKNMAKNMTLGIVSEGLWEEGMQSATSNYEKLAVKTGRDANGILGDVGGIYDEYIKGFGRTDDQLSMITGALIGGFMGSVGGIRETLQEQKGVNKIKELMGMSDPLFNQNYRSIFKTFKQADVDENGVQKNDAAGNPLFKDSYINPKTGKEEVDPEAVSGLLYDILLNKTLMDEAMAASLANNEVAANVVKNIALARLVKYYMDIDEQNNTHYASALLEAKLEMIAENAPNADKTDIMKELARNKKVVAQLEKAFLEAKANSKLTISNVQERKAFDSRRESAEVLQRMKLMTLEEERQRILGQPQTTPAQITKVQDQLSKIDSLIEDTRDTVSKLVSDQDVLFEDYQKEVKTQEEVVAKQKEISDKEDKLFAEIQELSKDPVVNKAALEAKTKEVEQLSIEANSYVAQKEIEYAADDLRDIYNIEDFEMDRLTPTYNENKIQYTLLKKLGKNFFVLQRAFEMKDKGVPLDKIMEWVSGQNVVPTAYAMRKLYVLDSAEKAVKLLAQNTFTKLNSLIGKISVLRDINATSSQLISILGQAFMDNAIAKITTAPSSLTSLERLVLDKLNMAYIREGKAAIPNIDTVTDDFYIIENNLDDDASKLLEDFVNILQTLSTKPLARLYDDLTKAFEEFNDWYTQILDNGLPATFFKNDFFTDQIMSLLGNINDDAIIALRENIRTNDTDKLYIDKILDAEDNAERQQWVHDYYVHKKTVGVKGFLNSVNRAEFSDVASVSKHIAALKGLKEYLNRSPFSTHLKASYDTMIDNLLSELEKLRQQAILNANDKQLTQLKAFFREREKFRFLLGGKINIDAVTGLAKFVPAHLPLAKALLSLIHSSLSPEETKVFNELLEKEGKIDDFEFLHDFIFYYGLHKVDTAQIEKLFSSAIAGLNNQLRTIYTGLSTGDIVNPIMTLTSNSLITNFSEAIRKIPNNDEQGAVRRYIRTNPNSFLNRFLRTRDFSKMYEDLKNDVELKALFPTPAAFNDFVSETEKVISILESINFITEVNNQLTKEVVALRNKENEILKDELAKKDGVVPTLEQLFSIRSIVGRLNKKLTKNTGVSHMILLNGTLGTGKTSIVPKWVMRMLNLKNSEVIAFGHNDNTSRQIAEVTGSAKTSAEAFISGTVADGIKLVIVDEIHTLDGDTLNKIVNKLYQINKTRAENNRLFLLGLGDTFQNVSGTQLLPPLYRDVYTFHDTTESTRKILGDKYDIFEAMPLTVRYRSAVSAINNFVDQFYGNTKAIDISKLTAAHSADYKMGVIKHSDKKDVIEKLKTAAGTSTIIVSNKADFDEYKKLLTDAGLDYYDLQDPAHSDYTKGSKIQLYMFTDANGVTVDNAFVDVKRSDFTNDYKYNTAMYTSIGRARALVSVNLPTLKVMPDPTVGKTSIAEEVKSIKEMMTAYKEAEAITMNAFKITPTVAKLPVTSPTTPPPTKPAITPTGTVLSDPDDGEVVIIEFPAKKDYTGLIVGDMAAKGNLSPSQPTKVALETRNLSQDVVLIVNEGKVHVLAKINGIDKYVSVAVLTEEEIAQKQAEGILPGINSYDDKNLSKTSSPHGDTYEINNPSEVLVTGKIVKSQLLAFRYDETITSPNTTDLTKELTTELEKTLGPIASITYVMYTDTGDSEKSKDADYANASAAMKNTVNAGFPYAKVKTKAGQTFFVNVPARVLNAEKDKAVFDVFKKATGLLRELESAFAIVPNFKKNNVVLGHMLFNTLLNRLHTFVSVRADGTIALPDFASERSRIVQDLADYIYETDVTHLGSTIKLIDLYTHVHGVKGFPSDKGNFITIFSNTQIYAPLTTIGVALMQMYYGVQTEPITVKTKETDPTNITAFLKEELDKVKKELTDAGSTVNMDNYTFVEGRTKGTYYLRISDDASSEYVRRNKLVEGKGELQKELNKLALANSRIMDTPFTVTKNDGKGKVSVSAKGFLSMSDVSGLSGVAKALRMFQARTLGVNTGVWINPENVDEVYNMTKEMYDRAVASVTSYRQLREEENLRREASNLGRRLQDRPDEYLTARIEDIKALWEEVEREKDLYDKGNTSTVTPPITTSAIENIISTDSNGNSTSKLRTQLTLAEFKKQASAHATDPTDVEANKYFNENLVMTLETVTPTSVEIELEKPKSTPTTTPVTTPLVPYAPPGEEGWLDPTKTEFVNDEGVVLRIGDTVGYTYVNETAPTYFGEITGFTRDGFAYTEVKNNEQDKRPFNAKYLMKMDPPTKPSAKNTSAVIEEPTVEDLPTTISGIEVEERDLIKQEDVPLGNEISLEEAYQLGKKLIPTLERWEVTGHLRLLNKEGREAFGRMVNGVVQLEQTKDGKVKHRVLLHEIFHKIWNYYLTEDERKKVEAVVLKEYGDVSNVEEYLAIMYQKTDPNKQSLLSWLWRKILAFFGHINRNHTSIQSLFENIHAGVYSQEISHPVSISRDLIKIEEQFGDNSRLYKIASVQLSNALGFLSNVHNVATVAFTREELAIQAYRALSGEKYNVNIQNLKTFTQRVKTFTTIQQMVRGGMPLKEAIQKVVKEAEANFATAQKTDNKALLSASYSTVQQLVFDGIIKAVGSSYDVVVTAPLLLSNKPDQEKVDAYLLQQEANKEALTHLLIPTTFVEMLRDWDKSMNLALIGQAIKKTNDKLVISEEVDDTGTALTPEQLYENENTWTKILQQIIDDEKLNKENNLTMTTKIFLSNLFETELDDNNEYVPKRDNNGYKISVNTRHAFAQMLNIFNEIDFYSINKSDNPLEAYRKQIKKVTKKIGAHKSTHGIVHELDKLVELVFSSTMDSGKQHTGFFRFLDTDTFVYTKNAAKRNVLFREYRSITKTEKEELEVVGLPQVTEAELRTDPDFIIVKKPVNMFVDKWLETLATDLDKVEVKRVVDGRTVTEPLFSKITLKDGTTTASTLRIYRDTKDPKKYTSEQVPVFSERTAAKLSKNKEIAALPSFTKVVLNEYYRRAVAQNTYVTVMNTFGNLVINNYHYVERSNKRNYITVQLRAAGKLTVSKAIQSTVVTDIKNALSKKNGLALLTTIIDTESKKEYAKLYAMAVDAIRKNNDETIKAVHKQLGLSGDATAGVLRAHFKKVNAIFGFNANVHEQIYDKITSISNEALIVMNILNHLNSLRGGAILKDDQDLMSRIIDDFKGTIERITAARSNAPAKISTDLEDETNEFAEEGVDFYAVLLEDSKGLTSNIAESMILDVDTERSTSIFGADKTRKYTASSRSHLKNVLQQLSRSAITLEYLDTTKEAATKWKNVTRSLFFHNNYLLKNRNVLVRSHKNSWKEHDAFKYNDNFVIDYADESPSLWLERVVMAGFFGNIRPKNTIYDHYMWTISNKRSTQSLQLSILTPKQIKESIGMKLAQMQERNTELSKYVANFDVDRFLNFGVLSTLVEQEHPEAVKFKASLKGGEALTKVEYSTLVKAIEDEIAKIATDLYSELEKNAISFPGNVSTIVKALTEGGQLELTDSQKDVSLPEVFIKYDETLRRTTFLSLSKEQKEVLTKVLEVFVKNYYLNAYDLNQMVSGDYAFFKDPFDIIKRYSGMAAFGIAPLLPTITGTTARILVGSDLTSRVTQELFKDTRVFGLLGKFTDAQLFMLPSRLQQLQRGMGTDYKLDVVTKPALYGMSTVRVPIGTKTNEKGEEEIQYRLETVPVMLKASGISLEDSICLIDQKKGDNKDNWTPLGYLRHNMRKLGTDEYIFTSGMKTGNPSKEYTADTSRMFTEDSYHETIAPNLEYFSRVVNNTDYRFQFNPASDVDGSIPNFTQLPYFLNILKENVVSSKSVYSYMAKLFDAGLNRIEEDDLTPDEQDDSLTKLDRKAINSIQSQGSERVRELLEYGISKSNPAVAVKFLNHLISYISKKSIKIKFPGSKLILQSPAGMNIKDPQTGKVRRLQYKEEEYIDENGKQQKRIYAEAIISSSYKDTVSLGDFLYNDALAVRIPTSEIHSAIPLRVVGFYDAKNSNVIVVPQEIVPLHGSDFDVDSLFVIRRETYAWNKQMLSFYDYTQKNAILGNKIGQIKNFIAAIDTVNNVLGKSVDNQLTLATKFEELEEVMSAGKAKYDKELNSKDFDVVKFEQDFSEWLNNTEHPKTKESLGTDKDGNQLTIFTWAIQKFGRDFDLNILRFSFSEQYKYNGDKRIAWRKFNDKKWTSLKEANTVYTEFKDGVAKGTIGERGRWVPIIPKDDKIDALLTEIEAEINMIGNIDDAAETRKAILTFIRSNTIAETNISKLLAADDKLDANDPNKLTEEQRTQLELDSIDELKRYYSKTKANLYRVFNETKQDLKETRERNTPVGYVMRSVEVIVNGEKVKKDKWILDPNFEETYKAEAALKGIPQKQIQNVLEQYYRNVMVESMLEVVSAERNKQRMFSPIMLYKFNEEPDTFEDNGLYKDGTVFRSLQNIIMRAKNVDENTPAHILKKTVSLKQKADMSNILHTRESFKSNFEGASLVGVFANEMRAVAYMIKGGFTFYDSYTKSVESIEIDGDKVKDGSSIPDKITDLSSKINDLILKINETYKDAEVSEELDKNIEELSKAQEEYGKLLRTYRVRSNTKLGRRILVEKLVPVGPERAFLTPKMSKDGITINGRTYNRLDDNIENWIMFDALLNAAIDNVKEQILPIVNGNKYTANALAAGLMMGMSMEDIALFLNQPIIKQLSELSTGSVQTRILSVKRQYENMLKEKLTDEEKALPVNQEDLENGFVKQVNGEELTEQEILIQLAVLREYEKLSKVGQDLFTLSRAVAIIRDMPVFVDEIMNNEDDWTELGTFDSNYNFTPNPSFSFSLVGWLDRLPHIVSAVKIRDKIKEKIERDFYMHSPSFTSVIDNLNGLPKSVPEEGTNRNKVARRFEAIKFIASGLYDTSKEAPYTYKHTTAKGTEVEAVLVGSKAFSQRFLKRLSAMKDFVRSNKVPTELEQFMQTLEVGINRYGEYFVRFTMGTNANYADILDTSAGFDMLKAYNVVQDGDNIVVEKNEDQSDFSEFQRDFVKYAALNYGVSMGTTNFTAIINKALIKEFDDSLKAYVEELQVLREDGGTALEDVIDLFEINFVANNSANLKFVERGIRAVTNVLEDEVVEYSGIDKVEGGLDIFYDLKFPNNHASEGKSEVDAAYPPYIIFGAYKMAYKRVYLNGANVYYQLIGKNNSTIYDLNKNFTYDKEDAFNPLVVTYFTNANIYDAKVGDTITLQEFGRPMPSYIKPGMSIYVTLKRDNNRQHRVPVRVDSMTASTMDVTILPNDAIIFERIASVPTIEDDIMTTKNVVQILEEDSDARFIIPTDMSLSVKKGIAKSLYDLHKEEKGRAVNIYFGAPESTDNARILSNLAPRTFTYKSKDGVERTYYSVEHAYQVLKSGEFNEELDKKYRSLYDDGRKAFAEMMKVSADKMKMRGSKAADRTNKFNLNLLKELVQKSILDQPNDSPVRQTLMTYDKFTHEGKEKPNEVDRAFVNALYDTQETLGKAAKSFNMRDYGLPIIITEDLNKITSQLDQINTVVSINPTTTYYIPAQLDKKGESINTVLEFALSNHNVKIINNITDPTIFNKFTSKRDALLNNDDNNLTTTTNC